MIVHPFLHRTTRGRFVLFQSHRAMRLYGSNNTGGDRFPNTTTVDTREMSKFASYGSAWWDTGKYGIASPLHMMNPCRVRYIERCMRSRSAPEEKTTTPLRGLRVADIGCGGGILSESLCKLGAKVVGVDPLHENIDAARSHAEDFSHSRHDDDDESLRYVVGTAEDLASSTSFAESFDIVCALEVIEHVADLDLFVKSCSRLVRPGGDLFVSTVNRTPLSYALGIVAAEYVLRMVPPGTHDWNKFVTPSELESALLRSNGTVIRDISGMIMDPLSGSWFLHPTRHEVNYIAHATREGDVVKAFDS